MLNHAEELRVNLRARGSNEQDIETVIAIMGWVETLDGLVFPGQPVNSEIVSRRPESGKEPYVLYEDNDDTIASFVDGLASFSQGQTENTSIHCSLSGKSLLEEDLHPSMSDVFTGIAAHEVRHRMQNLRPEVRLFTPIRFGDEFAGSGTLLGFLIQVCSILHEERPARLVERGCDPTYIARQTSVEEFDAQVVERYAVHLLYHKKELTTAEWVKILTIGPGALE